MATFDNSRILHIHSILSELKLDKSVSIKRIVYGQLFDKMTVCIFVADFELEKVFEKLLVNDIHIFPYNDEYKKKIISTYSKVAASPEYSRNKERTYYDNSSQNYLKKHYRPVIEKPEIILSQDDLLVTQIVKLKSIQKNKMEHAAKTNIEPKKEKISKSSTEYPNAISVNKDDSTIEKLCREGDYIGIRNIINKNPALNQYAREKFIPAIRNCINIYLTKGMRTKFYADEAISKLKNIVCDKEIKAITSDDLAGMAGNALINVCAKHDPDELIAVANLTQVQQKIKVMAFVQISEFIFENSANGKVNEEMLNYSAAKINTRAMLSSYDIMEAVISDLSKERFNRLFDAISKLK